MSIAMEKGKLIGWLVTIAISAAIMLIPVSETFTPEIRAYLMLSICVISIVAFDLMDIIIPSVLLPVAYYIFHVVPIQTAYAPFTTDTFWMILGAFVLTNALDECGILKRIAYWIIKTCGGTYNRTLYALYLVGLILGIITFCGHYLLLISLAYGICKAMGFGRSKESLLIMMVGGIAGLNVKLFAYRPSTMSMMVTQVKTIDPGFSVTFLDQMLYNCPSVLMAVSFIWLLTKIYKSHTFVLPGGKQYFEEEYRNLGPMSPAEKKAAVLLAILMIWISTEPLHGISANYSFMTLPWLCFVPGINIGTRKSINQINLGVIFFVAACLGIGIVGTKLGFTQLLAGKIAENISGIGVNCFLFLMLFLSTLVNLILSPGAMMAVLPAPFASLSLQLGMNPLPSLLTIIYSTDFVFLPHEVPAYLIMFGFGLMTMKDFIKLHLMKIAWFTLLFGLIQIPFWYAMGIIMQ